MGAPVPGRERKAKPRCAVVGGFSLHADVAVHGHERPHQGVGNRLLLPEVAANGDGPIQCRQRLGGLLRYYTREAA